MEIPITTVASLTSTALSIVFKFLNETNKQLNLKLDTLINSPLNTALREMEDLLKTDNNDTRIYLVKSALTHFNEAISMNEIGNRKLSAYAGKALCFGCLQETRLLKNVISDISNIYLVLNDSERKELYGKYKGSMIKALARGALYGFDENKVPQKDKELAEAIDKEETEVLCDFLASKYEIIANLILLLPNIEERINCYIEIDEPKLYYDRDGERIKAEDITYWSSNNKLRRQETSLVNTFQKRYSFYKAAYKEWQQLSSGEKDEFEKLFNSLAILKGRKYISLKIVEVECNNLKSITNNILNFLKTHPECGKKILCVIYRMLLIDHNLYESHSLAIDYKHWWTGENIPVCEDYLNKK